MYGSQEVASMCTGARGVIRNTYGDWIGGFSVNLGQGKILEAEIWGLFFGFKLAKDKGISHLLVEMDVDVPVHCYPLTSLGTACCDLMNQFDSCALRHIYREQNHVVDGLATWSYNLDLRAFDFDFAPVWLSSRLVYNMFGVTRGRLVVVVSLGFCCWGFAPLFIFSHIHILSTNNTNKPYTI